MVVIETYVAIAHVVADFFARSMGIAVVHAMFGRLLPKDNLLRYLVEGLAYVNVALCRRERELDRDFVLGLHLRNPELDLFSNQLHVGNYFFFVCV